MVRDEGGRLIDIQNTAEPVHLRLTGHQVKNGSLPILKDLQIPKKIFQPLQYTLVLLPSAARLSGAEPQRLSCRFCIKPIFLDPKNWCIKHIHEKGARNQMRCGTVLNETYVSFVFRNTFVDECLLFV